MKLVSEIFQYADTGKWGFELSIRDENDRRVESRVYQDSFETFDDALKASQAAVEELGEQTQISWKKVAMEKVGYEN